MIRIFIGYDHVEEISYSVLASSLSKHSSQPLSITPIRLSHLPEISRERDPKQSNDFAFSRWLVPYLCNYEGWAIFMDCDFLARDDIAKLWELRDDRYAVQVVKHDYIPKTELKFLGQEQTKYFRKNWSSMMLINCAKCKALTPEYVNTAHGLALHRFEWLESEDLIGEIPKEWNWLVGEYDYNENAKLIHFTIGGPWFYEYFGSDYAEEWDEAKRYSMYCDQLIIPTVKQAKK